MSVLVYNDWVCVCDAAVFSSADQGGYIELSRLRGSKANIDVHGLTRVDHTISTIDLSTRNVALSLVRISVLQGETQWEGQSFGYSLSVSLRTEGYGKPQRRFLVFNNVGARGTLLLDRPRNRYSLGEILCSSLLSR